MSSNTEVDFHIRHNYSWTKLPASVKQSFGNSQNEYEKAIVNFSIKNQLRYRGNLVSKVHPTEQRYYEEVLAYSQAKLLLYPYHLSDMMVQGLRATPFQYYLCILEAIMEAERSYDSLPNFTAADCLRLLGIGRNEYIELMNQARSGRKLFRRKPARSLLPQRPLTIPVDPWWIVQLGCIMEEDIKIVNPEEKKLIDLIIDKGKGQKAGILDLPVVHSLYKKGLIYLDVPIEDSDYVVVPPLEGFVMNRVLGDYFETLLYKIFVSIDEHTSVGELASVLQIDTDSVKSAVSLYCRLGFARKKNRDNDISKLHPSWHQYASSPKTDIVRRVSEELRSEPEMMLELNATPVNDPGLPTPCVETKPLPGTDEDTTFLEPVGFQQRTKRIAFLFDSTLTAFLMMGNLSPGLKSHAVTMFEVGKLADESLGSLLGELERVHAGVEGGEGEAQRYFDHALILRHTVRALRANPELGSLNLPLDLVRCESLQSLDPVACARLLNKNYSLLVSMAPLCKEIRPVSSCSPPHLGPALPEVNSVWFKLFLYHLTGRGPPSLLITKGTRVRHLPPWLISGCEKLLVTVWGHDPATLPVSSIIFTLNDALSHSAVLIQAFGWNKGAETVLVPFPFLEHTKGGSQWQQHDAVRSVSEVVDLEHNCGYVTLARLSPSQPTAVPANNENDSPMSSCEPPQNGIQDQACAAILADELRSLDPSFEETPPLSQGEWTLLDCSFGVPLFDAVANESILQAIVGASLWKPDSLLALTQSSRLLCLRLLDFIGNFQDRPVIPEDLTGVHPGVSNKKLANLSVVLPTQNLSFHDGKLETWRH